MWSKAAGGGTRALNRRRLQLHHWFRTQVGGGSNAGWNYLPISQRLNRLMNDGRLFTPTGRITINTIKKFTSFNIFRGAVLGIYGGIPTGSISKATCGCNK